MGLHYTEKKMPRCNMLQGSATLPFYHLQSNYTSCRAINQHGRDILTPMIHKETMKKIGLKFFLQILPVNFRTLFPRTGQQYELPGC